MPSVNKSISTLHGVAPELPPYGMSHISRQEYRALYHSRANVHEQGLGIGRRPVGSLARTNKNIGEAKISVGPEHCLNTTLVY